MAQDNISQVSEEIEGRVTKKLSEEFSRTESRILGALSKLDEFLRNAQVRTCSVAVPGTTRNSDSRNREPNGDRSPSDPCPQAMISSHHSVNLNSSEGEECPHMVTGVQEEIRYCPHMVTRGPEDIRNRPHMMTRIQDEIPYCSPGTSSGKQKKAKEFDNATPISTIEKMSSLHTL